MSDQVFSFSTDRRPALALHVLTKSLFKILAHQAPIAHLNAHGPVAHEVGL
jgi:hypothetical protein